MILKLNSNAIFSNKLIQNMKRIRVRKELKMSLCALIAAMETKKRNLTLAERKRRALILGKGQRRNKGRDTRNGMMRLGAKHDAGHVAEC
jgi:hypothetical protein